MYPEESITESPLQQANSKHLLDYIRVLQKRKWLVLTVAGIIFLTTALATFSKTPLYTATIQVLVEKNMEKGRLEGLASYITWDPDFKATQTQTHPTQRAAPICPQPPERYMALGYWAARWDLHLFLRLHGRPLD